MIKAVLIDIDDTILDFTKSAKDAIKKTFSACGLNYENYISDVFIEINEVLWKKLERLEITKQQLYATRWVTIFRELGIDYDDPSGFEELFRSTLSGIAVPVDNAPALLDHLYKKYPIYAASNSTYKHQKMRLAKSDMLKYFEKLFVSDVIGITKPSKEYFEKCLQEMGDIHPQEAVIIGDSLTSDILGGTNSGLKTIWFNPKKHPIPAFPHPDHTVNSLLEIIDIL